MKRRACAVACLAILPHLAMANGIGENNSWQFQTTQDKVNRATALDQIEKKKAGYYDAMKPVYTYNTYIDKQFNCSVQASSNGNSGVNATTANTATANPSGTTASSSSGNDASNGLGQNGLGVNSLGVVSSGANTTLPTGSLANTQTNSGSQTSGVSGSPVSVTGAPVNVGAGPTDQALNSNQTNSGSLTASVANSTACAGPLNGN